MEEETPKKRKPIPPKGVQFTAETAREKGALGGKKTAEVKREKKLLSAIYAEYIAKANGIDGYTDIKDVISAVLERGDSASVSMMKEIREATEGSKIEHSGTMTTLTAPLSVAEAKRRMKEIEDSL